ncbi:MAG: hypothetical protein ACK5Z5_04060 [Neisseriaceae bacterium]
MTTGGLIFFVGFCLAIGIFALFAFYNKDNSSSNKNHHRINNH